MIKGLAITPPVIGRISIGHIVERNGKRLPEKDDYFTITTQVQNREGWLNHPLQTKLAEGTANGKLRAIPVRLLFNSPELNLRAQYSLFDRSTGRPVCVGDGDTAKRSTGQGVQDLPCPSPIGCEFGQSGGCKLFGRLNVQVEGQDDDLGSFIFRTTGYNSVRTLAARLGYLNAISGGNARHLPLMLRLRGKTTTLSRGTPVYYADLTLREGDSLIQAIGRAREEAAQQREAGIETALLEEAARRALANGSFEESEDEVPTLVEEFYPESSHAA
ncbi:MAG TPA: hydrolase or metal-binding protein [Rhodocyclaceae bacterium]|nr:hydrolase or metal-binding protein [Rhodocyclaceae bacterium]